MPGILSLDQSTKLGWAWLAEGGADPLWGTVLLGRRGAPAGEVGAALWRFLEEKCRALTPDLVIYETPYVPRNDEGRVPINAETMRRLLGLAFLIDAFTTMFNIDCREVGTATAALFMTGRGRYPNRQAKKQATVNACLARGWKVTEDEADAVAILLFAESKIFPEASLRRQKVLKLPCGPLFEVMT